MSKLVPRAQPPVLSLSKDGPLLPAVVRQAHHGVGDKSVRQLRVLRGVLLLVCTLLVLSAATCSVQANWLSKVVGAAEHAGPRAARLGSGALENAVVHLR